MALFGTSCESSCGLCAHQACSPRLARVTGEERKLPTMRRKLPSSRPGLRLKRNAVSLFSRNVNHSLCSCPLHPDRPYRCSHLCVCMLEAPDTPAARSYEQIQQSLQSLVQEYHHLDSSCAQELAGKLRTIVHELEGQHEVPSSHGAAPSTEAALDSHDALARLENSWSSPVSRDAASGTALPSPS